MAHKKQHKSGVDDDYIRRWHAGKLTDKEKKAAREFSRELRTGEQANQRRHEREKRRKAASSKYNRADKIKQ